MSCTLFKYKLANVLMVSLSLLFTVDLIQMGKHNPKRTVSMITELQQVSTMCARLQDMLATVAQYVDDIIVSITRSSL